MEYFLTDRRRAGRTKRTVEMTSANIYRRLPERGDLSSVRKRTRPTRRCQRCFHTSVAVASFRVVTL